jgi:hypothetical protein
MVSEGFAVRSAECTNLVPGIGISDWQWPITDLQFVL